MASQRLEALQEPDLKDRKDRGERTDIAVTKRLQDVNKLKRTKGNQ